MRYISEEVKQGFKTYKYNSKDTSPLSVYIMHPFWDWIVKFLPYWLAPNLMTLLGFLFCVVNFLMLAYYDPDFSSVSKEFTDVQPVPNWIWLLCAIFNFVSHTLDGCDGKQARRTGTSGPIGEMFDHGCDSWATLFFPVCLYSVFGRGEFGTGCFNVLYLVWAIMGCFLLSHWEKYNTGVLYLPWGYDLAQVGMSIIYFCTYIFTSDAWQNYIGGTAFTYAHIVIAGVHFSFWVLSLPCNIWNVYQSYALKTGNMHPAHECFRPLVPTGMLILASILWAHYSPTDIIHQHTRIFYTLMGTAFSNIASRLIVSQMSRTRCELLNPLGMSYCLLVALILAFPSHMAPYEAVLLLGFTGVFILLHIVYACIVVNEMLDYFGLRAFVIKPKISTSPTQKAANQSTKKK